MTDQAKASDKTSDSSASDTLEKLRAHINYMVRSVAEKIVPVISQKAVSDSLQGLLPNALGEAVDAWHQAPINAKIAELRQGVDADGKAFSPLPVRQTSGASGYDLRYCPQAGIKGLDLRPHSIMGQSGLSVDAKSIVTLYPGYSALLPTGIAVAIPEGYEGQVRSRSGLACRGLVVDNSPGTVDSDYRISHPSDMIGKPQPAEVKVLLHYHGLDSITIKPGDRIAQLVFCEAQSADFEQVPVDKWTETVTGAGVNRVGGFGSTGQ